ncbi:CDP-archaeol synthase [Bradyrhizobium sp. SZCCHNS3004]|uniref:CDP-archaeol synthase n=2 Tax=unclassified Bradyrhizobium TaxID=2631580 RepID=UPI002916CCA8|nr:CDP-archaeol synthase [Bradyrhizobium sp. SZCCHNS3004]
MGGVAVRGRDRPLSFECRGANAKASAGPASHPMQITIVVKLLTLLTVANGVPVIAKRLMGGRWSWPLDGGCRFFDGRPLLGESKTVRGLVLSIVTTSVAALLLGLDASTGFLVGVAAMAGDLFSSFVKRRLGLTSSSQATGLDQIPESLVPTLLCWYELDLTAADVAAVAGIFLVGEIVLSRLLFWLKIRDRPY